MATLDKHAERQNWDSVGGRPRLPEDHPMVARGDSAPKSQQVVDRPPRVGPPTQAQMQAQDPNTRGGPTHHDPGRAPSEHTSQR